MILIVYNVVSPFLHELIHHIDGRCLPELAKYCTHLNGCSYWIPQEPRWRALHSRIDVHTLAPSSLPPFRLGVEVGPPDPDRSMDRRYNHGSSISSRRGDGLTDPSSKWVMQWANGAGFR